jgi:protoporphyrinogen oxidase
MAGNMKKQNNRIVILGGGPAGLSCAYSLLRRFGKDIELTIIEKQPYIGGLASGFEYEGLVFDYGSHRLHPTTREDILKDIQNLLGNDLLDRPRDGRIRLLERFVKFPLKIVDFMFHLPFSFFLGILRDTITSPFRKKKKHPKTFADVLLHGLGRTICTHFYFPYAEKLWGLPPDRLSYIQAQRRVSANSIWKIIRKVLSIIPIFRKKGTGRFYYPKKGFLQLVQAFALSIKKSGGEIHLSNAIREIDIEKQYIVTDKGKKIVYDLLFSTIPVTDLIEALKPVPPRQVGDAVSGIQYRGMLFCYLILSTQQFTRYDAHYFPDTTLIFSRLSEPKNYSASLLPENCTGLCAEIPCAVGGQLWYASEEEIAEKVMNDLEKVGLPVKHLVKKTFVRRTGHAYPSYNLAFEKRISIIEDYLNTIPHLIPFGRQALFVHDNTHHTIEMGYAASDCVKPDLAWDNERWRMYREEFKEHVVED